MEDIETIVLSSETENELDTSADVMEIDEVLPPKNNVTIAEEKKNLGNDQYKAQNYQSALKLYSDAITACPETASYYGNRAACYIMLGNYKAALQDARTSIQLDGKFEKGYVRIAKCCITLGDIIGTEQAIKKLKEIDPTSTAASSEEHNCEQLKQYENRIQSNYEKQIYRTVVYFLDNALKIAPACLRYKLLKAECLAFLGRVDEAGDIAITAMKMDSCSADAIYVRGLCLYYSDNLEKGIVHFERALQLDPDHSKAKEMRLKSKKLKEKKEKGNVLFKSGKFKEAHAVYTEALEIDAHNKDMNSKLLYNRALVNSKLGNLRDSITDCSKVLEINSQYLKAILLRAKCNNELEKYDDCVKDYEAALKIQKTTEIKNLLRDAKFALKKSKRKDYYKILGITKSANEEEIKKAYRKKALVHHPDRHANSSDVDKKEQELKFKEIGEAYSILSDPRKKMRYDSGQDMEDDQHTDIDPSDVFRHFFQFSSDDGPSCEFQFSRDGGTTFNFF